MKFGPKRGHFLYIFDRFFVDFGLLMVALIAGLVSGNFIDALLSNFFVVIIVAIAPIRKLFHYLFTTIAIDEENMTLRKGVFVKHVIAVPISTVTTIDVSQSILCQLFKVYKIKIDNASNIALGNDGSKVTMIFPGEDIDRIKELLHRKEGSYIDGFNLVDEAEGNSSCASQGLKEAEAFDLKVPVSKIILMGFLESKWMLILEGIGAAGIITNFLRDNILDEAMDLFITLSYLLMIGVIIFTILLMMGIGSVISAVTYAGFKVGMRGDSIKLSYGLITKKAYTLKKNRISGFNYKQSWLMRRFHVGTLEVFAIGFGQDTNDSKETAVIHPLIEESRLMEFINSFSMGFSETEKMEKPKKKALRYFFYKPSFVMACILFICAIIISFNMYEWMWFIGLLIFTVSISGTLMEYKSTRLGMNNQNLEVISGGMNRKRTFIKRNSIEAISDKGTVFKRKKGIVSLKIDFLGPLASTSVRVRNLSDACSEKLHEYIEY